MDTVIRTRLRSPAHAMGLMGECSGPRRRLDDGSLAVILDFAGKGPNRPANGGPDNCADNRHDRANYGPGDSASDGPADFFAVALADRGHRLLGVWLVLRVWLILSTYYDDWIAHRYTIDRGRQRQAGIQRDIRSPAGHYDSSRPTASKPRHAQRAAVFIESALADHWAGPSGPVEVQPLALRSEHVDAFPVVWTLSDRVPPVAFPGYGR